MAKYLNWDDVAEPTKNSGGQRTGGKNSGKFLKAEANQTYLLRPILKPVGFFQYTYINKGQLRRARVADPENCSVRAKHPTELKKAQERRAFLAFDRNDANKLKIVDLPASAMEPFKHFKRLAKVEPGSAAGVEIKLSVICPNGKKDRDTTYEIEFGDPVPFTTEERKFWDENKKDYNLEEIFAANTPEEIEKRLFGDWDNKGTNNNAAPGKTASAPKQTASVNSSNDIGEGSDDTDMGSGDDGDFKF